MTMRRKHSDVWNYFKDNKDGSAACTVCDNTFSFKSSASNLKKHLKRKHSHINLKSVAAKVEIVDMDDFDVADRAIDLNEKHGNVPGKDLGKSVEDSISFDDDGFDKDYNPLSDSSGSGSGSQSVAKMFKKWKDRDDKFPLEVNHELYDTESSEEDIKLPRKSINLGKTKAFVKTDGFSTDSSDSIKDPEIIAMKNSRFACDAYAANLSLQLDQMEDNQRFIAEKLISDVVFYGRFNKLTEEMQLLLPHQNESSERVVTLGGPDDSSRKMCSKCNGQTVYNSNDASDLATDCKKTDIRSVLML